MIKLLINLIKSPFILLKELFMSLWHIAQIFEGQMIKIYRHTKKHGLHIKTSYTRDEILLLMAIFLCLLLAFIFLYLPDDFFIRW